MGVEEAVGLTSPLLQPTDLYAHPRHLVAQAVEVYGKQEVVDTCLALLDGETRYESLGIDLTFLGGAGAKARLARGDLADRGQGHWPRVWAARGLRYSWLPYAEPGIVCALADPAWRVREMAAKVVALHECGSAADALEPLLSRELPRVQVAAIRALGVVGEAEQAALLDTVDSPEKSVQVALAAARRTLRLRLDHSW